MCSVVGVHRLRRCRGRGPGRRVIVGWGWSSNWHLPSPCLINVGIGDAAVASSLAPVGQFGTLRGPSWARASPQLIPAVVVGGKWQRRLKPGVGHFPWVCEPVSPCGSTDRTASLRFGRSYSHMGSCVSGVCVVPSLDSHASRRNKLLRPMASKLAHWTGTHNLSDFGGSSPATNARRLAVCGRLALCRAKVGPETKREPRRSGRPLNRG